MIPYLLQHPRRMTDEKRAQYERDVETAKRIAANESVSFELRQAAAADGILKLLAMRGYPDRSLSAREDW